MIELESKHRLQTNAITKHTESIFLSAQYCRQETPIANDREQTQLSAEGEETADRQIYCESRRQQCDEWSRIS